MRSKFFQLLLLSILFIPFTQAKPANATLVVSAQFTIQQFAHAYDVFTAYVKHNLTGFTSCGCSDCSQFVIRDTSATGDNYKSKVPYLLAAFMAGKNVQLAYDNAGGANCYSNNPIATIVYVVGP